MNTDDREQLECFLHSESEIVRNIASAALDYYERSKIEEIDELELFIRCSELITDNEQQLETVELTERSDLIITVYSLAGIA